MSYGRFRNQVASHFHLGYQGMISLKAVSRESAEHVLLSLNNDRLKLMVIVIAGQLQGNSLLIKKSRRILELDICSLNK